MARMSRCHACQIVIEADTADTTKCKGSLLWGGVLLSWSCCNCNKANGWTQYEQLGCAHCKLRAQEQLQHELRRESEQKAKEEQERRAKDEQERRAKKEQERRAKEEQERETRAAQERQDALDRSTSLRSVVKLALRYDANKTSAASSKLDLSAWAEGMFSSELAAAQEGHELLLTCLSVLDGAGQLTYGRVQQSWAEVRSLQDDLSAAQEEVAKLASEGAAGVGAGEDLRGGIARRDEVRQSLVAAWDRLFALLHGSQKSLEGHQTTLEQLTDKLETYLRCCQGDPTPSSSEERGQSAATTSSASLREQLEDVETRMLQWVEGVNRMLMRAREERLEIARTYADGLRLLTTLLDGSGTERSREEAKGLQEALPKVHVALEEAFVSEEMILSDQSLLDSFPFTHLREGLQTAVIWIRDTLFTMGQQSNMKVVQASTEQLKGLEEPGLLFAKRDELKNAMEALEDELMTCKHKVEWNTRKKLSCEKLEEEIDEIKKKLVASTKELEMLDNRLWSLVDHYPEYKRNLVQELDVSLYDKLDMYDVVKYLSRAGHAGARHNVIRVRQGGDEFVIKEYWLSSEDDKHRRRFLQEVSILRRLEHPFLINMYGAFVEEQQEAHGLIKGYLKMPFLEGGTLWEWFLSVQPSEQHKHRVLLQVLLGIEHLRQNRIIHCDIKPSNILMSSQLPDAEPKIADFDVSKEQKDRAQDLVATVTSGTHVVGTLRYMAPELVNPSSTKRRASHKSDMFSYGIVMLELLTGSVRGGSLDDATQLAGLAGDARGLIEKLLEADPRARLSSVEALAHAYFCHSMIVEREHLAKERMKMQEAQDREMALLVHQQQLLADQEKNIRQQREHVQLEQRKILEQQKELASKGQQLEFQAVAKKQQLQEQKQELLKQDGRLKKQQHDLQSKITAASKQQAELERKQKDLEKEKQLLAQDRAVLNPPLYWQESKQNPLHALIKVDVTAAWKDRIQELMSSTCIPQYIGRGNNNRGLTHTGYRVERVFRVENLNFWSAYALQRQATASLPMQLGKRHPKSKVATWRDWMKKELACDRASNEVFLFHGTKPDIVDAILTAGLDERVCSLSGLFGAGIYLAENSSKSDEYCRPDRNGLCHMFLVRALLGTPYEAVQPMNNARRPPMMADHRVFDSVIGVTTATHPGARLLMYREFIVYDRRQTYPEFLVEFLRI